ncbi:fructose-bisphosphate aldolase [Filobacillus milosensis]|uniref:2-amino-3,7-dideoxy-D-threo-hept-6-ulosonate synthase n=1 Tax=Filobacillus milosensis TaxID=94137 RepID=A0A4Y8IMC8_9BACI|nr:2-amino-3,7-dideoxy-D-threo-hept-6-ulosonate synthase [Filobacillus milosensis]TFB21368.1 fructose-bisphosphate aldolase [Filobacillus milosensis]
MKGKDIRLKRLYKHSDKLFVVAMDHGITMGPIEGIVDIKAAAKAVYDGYADAIVVHKGLVRDLADIDSPSLGEIMVHLSASTNLSQESNRKELVSTVEHAIRIGASAISVHVNLGSEHEGHMLQHLGMVAEECDQWGMPLLAMMYVRDGNPENEFDAGKIKHAARIAEELGADIVKVNYSGDPESFREVTSSVNIPVVIAGGSKLDSHYDFLAMVADAIQSGAGGVSIGRNVYQSKNPTLVAKQLRYIMDNKLTREEIQGFLDQGDLIL